MGTSGNSDCQWASGGAVKDFTEDALAISAGNLFQNGTARTVKAKCRRCVQHRCWWNLNAWPRSRRPSHFSYCRMGLDQEMGLTDQSC